MHEHNERSGNVEKQCMDGSVVYLFLVFGFCFTEGFLGCNRVPLGAAWAKRASNTVARGRSMYQHLQNRDSLNSAISTCHMQILVKSD